MTVVVSTEVKIPKFRLLTPKDPKFWNSVGLELARDIRKRTERGMDADNRSFKPYKKATAADRAKRGRSQRVNLTDSGRMLGAIAKGVKGTKHGVSIKLSGRQGFKAWNIKFNQRRNFFALNNNQVIKVIRKINNWMQKKNK